MNIFISTIIVYEYLYFKALTHWLRDAGIARLVVGHQPHGDAPLVIQCANGVQVVSI